jgi:hypothetical protein
MGGAGVKVRVFVGSGVDSGSDVSDGVGVEPMDNGRPLQAVKARIIMIPKND